MALVFVGEQDGVPERELKAELISLFSRWPDVQAAYLAVARDEATSETDVILCLRLDSAIEELRLVEKIGDIFRKMFSVAEHLDVLFIDQVKERELIRVCRPFFQSAPSR